MQRCLQLAAMGAGQVAPNPLVGAVLVYKGKVIGEGYHQIFGGPHAEVNCINSVAPAHKKYIEKSTLYVSLEPCAHFGKTPPCADLIMANKISQVVIGCRDSYKEVDGRGIEKLYNAGVHITTGMLENECRAINRRFFTFHEKQRPYIILKWAQSRDKKISLQPVHAATGKMPEPGGAERLMISNDFTNRLVHKWRSEEDGILVGTNTALLDNPSLTTRHWPGKNPVRLVIDTALKLPRHLHVFDGNTKTIVFNYLKNAEENNLVYYQLNKDGHIVTQIAAALFTMQLQSVIIEGGSKLLQSFIEVGLWDEARIITNDQLTAGNGLSAPVLKNGLLVDEQQLNSDSISFYTKDI